MGLRSSREKAVLEEGKKMRDHLYARAEAYKNNNQRAFSQIDVNFKKRILRSSGIQIADMLDNKETTAVIRTIDFGVKSNYVFDQMFEQALAQAEECDRQRARDQYKKKCWRPGMNAQDCYPPFYGVPASVKQTILMKGRQTHAGFIAKVNPLTDQDGLFMIMIRKMGFISFARGNVSQACKTLQTNNNIFGYCKNPWIPNRSCGGSSGGQSGMVSSNCAPIGFGSDIGGSLRVPAAFTGLVTLKPHNRYSRFGNAYYGKFTGGMPIKAEMGVLSKTVQDAIVVNGYLYDPDNYVDIPAEQRDPHQIYTPLRMDIINQNKKYKIGVVRRLKHAHCSRANERAIDMAAQILKQKGHQLVQVDLGKIQKLYLFVVNLFTFDQELNIFREFKGDQPLTVEYKIIALLSKIPWIIRRILIWFISKKQPRLAQMLKASRPMSAVKILERIYEIQKIICPQIYKTFTSNKLDAVIMPSFATPAPRHGDIRKLQYFFGFTLGWNVLYYPVGVLPITVVRPDQMHFNDTFNDFYTRSARHTMEQSQGLPIGVQVASTPYNQQKILRLMKQIESEAKFHQYHRIPE